MKKRFIAVLMSAMLAAGILAGCGGLEDSDVVATVGKTEIKGNVANFYARYQQAMYETSYSSMLGGDEMWSVEVEKGKTYEDTVKESALEALEDLYLVNNHAADYKIELTEEEEKKISEAADAFVKANGENVREVISGDKETVKELLKLVTIQQKARGEMVKDVDKNVSDEEAAQKKMQYVTFYYAETAESEDNTEDGEENQADTKEEAKAKADAFLKDIKNGTDFSKAAENQGTTPSELAFDSESTAVREEVIKAADKLKEGGTTDVIETETGFYVAKLTSMLDREATDSKKEEIIAGREQDRYDELLKKWRKEDKVRENKKVWKKLDFEDQGVTIKTEDENSGNAGE